MCIRDRLKHGTIALIEDDTLVVALMTQKELIEKTMSNVKEVKARGAYVVGLVQQEDQGRVEGLVDRIITVPNCAGIVAPILTVIPLQLFAYYVAVQKGCDVDKPRNLAKSVTVE